MPNPEGDNYSRVTAKGQITLPARLRERLGIEPGDLVEITTSQVDDEVLIAVRKRPSMIEATAGIARPKSTYRPPEWHEIEEIVKDEMAQRLHREMNE